MAEQSQLTEVSSDFEHPIDVELITLGALHCSAAGKELKQLPAQKLKCSVLTYLAVERSAQRDKLLAMLWPDDRDTEHTRHGFSQIVSELRKDVGKAWVDVSGDKLTISEGVRCDLLAFEQAVQAGDFSRALDLYRGEFLHGVYLVRTNEFQTWLDTRRNRAERMHRQARRELIRVMRESGTLDDALDVAVRWTELNPIEDEAHQRVIELLAAMGRRTEAIAHYELYERIIQREDLKPLDDLVAFADKLRADTSTRHSERRESQPETEGADKSNLPGTEDFLASDLEPIRLIDEGSTARVYLAREPQLTRLVAVKVLSAAYAKNEVAKLRFEREAKSAARIHHPNVVSVFRVGRFSNGTPFLVMPYIAGGLLRDRLVPNQPLAVDEARRNIAQLAAGLAAAHENGVVHRDVRPDNVHYDHRTGRLMLADFGIAAVATSGDRFELSLTKPGERLGDVNYSSPEQLRGEPVTDRADVYSLGVVAFEMLTGQLPFDAGSLVEMIKAHLYAEPLRIAALRPELDRDLAVLVERCLSKRAEQRPFASELAVTFLRGLPHQ